LKFEIIQSANIFALPSHGEEIALVVAEAICCGTVPLRSSGGENGFYDFF
jgi:glycosyltransferase involved in cell wall biosynthesis